MTAGRDDVFMLFQNQLKKVCYSTSVCYDMSTIGSPAHTSSW